MFVCLRDLLCSLLLCLEAKWKKRAVRRSGWYVENANLRSWLLNTRVDLQWMGNVRDQKGEILLNCRSADPSSCFQRAGYPFRKAGNYDEMTVIIVSPFLLIDSI